MQDANEGSTNKNNAEREPEDVELDKMDNKISKALERLVRLETYMEDIRKYIGENGFARQKFVIIVAGACFIFAMSIGSVGYLIFDDRFKSHEKTPHEQAVNIDTFNRAMASQRENIQEIKSDIRAIRESLLHLPDHGK